MLNITTHDRFHASAKEKHSSPKILIISSKKVFIQIRKKTKTFSAQLSMRLTPIWRLWAKWLGHPQGRNNWGAKYYRSAFFLLIHPSSYHKDLFSSFVDGLTILFHLVLFCFVFRYSGLLAIIYFVLEGMWPQNTQQSKRRNLKGKSETFKRKLGN